MKVTIAASHPPCVCRLLPQAKLRERAAEDKMRQCVAVLAAWCCLGAAIELLHTVVLLMARARRVWPIPTHVPVAASQVAAPTACHLQAGGAADAN